MIFSLLGTLLTYVLSLIFLSSTLDVYYAIDYKIITRIIILTFICWFPFFVYSKVRARLFPEAHEKLNKQ